MLSKIFRDIKSSINYTKLTNLNKLLNFVQENNIKNIIINDISRLNRDRKFIPIFDDLKNKINFHFVGEKVVINKDTSNEDYKKFIDKFIFGCEYSESLSKRCKDNAAHRKKIGQFNKKKAPFGFKIVSIYGKKFINRDNSTYKVAKSLKTTKPIIKERVIKYFNLSDKDVKDIRENLKKYDNMHKSHIDYVNSLVDTISLNLNDVKI